LKIKKYQKITLLLLCFFAVSMSVFFSLSVGEISAVDLEVKYPTIKTITGQSINIGTKLPDFALYLFYAGMSLGYFSVLISLVIAGVMYFLSPAKPDLLASAKDRISGAISGLLILTFTYLIITTINPQLNAFKLDDLPAVPEAPIAQKKPSGVYFYKESGCSDENAQPYTANIPDLGDLKNRIGSIDIVKDNDTKTAYISILYDNTNLWGKCQYVNPNKDCSAGASWVASASVHQYDFDPNGDGVYFFRKACFNKVDKPYSNLTGLVNYCKEQSAGWYKVDNSKINGIFDGDEGELQSMVFNDVPENEQDCIEYDKNEKCTKRTPPKLSGENISSIIIKGNYIVLFVYQSPDGSAAGPWTFCQEFPISGDVNNFGPQQIKWEKIRNGGGLTASGINVGSVVPNYVLIFPVKN